MYEDVIMRHMHGKFSYILSNLDGLCGQIHISAQLLVPNKPLHWISPLRRGVALYCNSYHHSSCHITEMQNKCSTPVYHLRLAYNIVHDDLVLHHQ